MKISLNWLREYVDFDLELEDLVHQLTMTGLEVEGFEEIKAPFYGVVAGKVLHAEKHPSADKLKVCDVDVGDETLKIVCGAPNVAAGQTVPVAKVGAELQGDFKIKPVKLRGVDSYGMICSERELGLSEAHQGIWVLDDSRYELGDNLAEALFSEDTVLEVNVTPNRPDCLSHIGVARELALVLATSLKKPQISLSEINDSVESAVDVNILDSKACPRYSVRIIKNVKIGPSPSWMKERLEAVGVRSINNVVDITNYVLMETGQPLHAFDYDLIEEHQINVRMAEKGEKFTTLDGKTHQLNEEDLLICDGKRGVALAGVMGGENSEISDTTVNILLESAYFDPMTVRKTAKRLGMSTEASQRFERGADPENTIYAADRAAQLFQDYADGQVLKNTVDVYPEKITGASIEFRMERIPKVLGTEISREKVIQVFKGLELSVEDTNPLKITAPTFRPDLTREIDLIEEIVRHYGYDTIEPRMHTNMALSSEDNKELVFVENIRDLLVGMGFSETWSISLVSGKHIQTLTPDVPAVEIKNPLSPEAAYLRTTLATGLLDAVLWNQNRGQKQLKLFEIGKAFQARKNQLPIETNTVMCILTGDQVPQTHWQKNDAQFDFYQLKGVLRAILERIHVSNFDIVKDPHDLFTTQSSLLILSDNQKIGWFGEIKTEILNTMDIQNKVFGFHLNLDILFESVNHQLKYQTIPRFPAVKRDLAVIIEKDFLVEDVIKEIKKTGGVTLKSVDMFDIYEGDSIPGNKKSVAFSLMFQSLDKTLTESEIDPVFQKIIRNLEQKVNASLRS